MKVHTILAFAFLLAVRAACQDGPKLPAQAQCKFSDGTNIRVSYSYERHSYLFKTDGRLVTIKGIRVPSGDYAISIARNEYNSWTLRIRKEIPRKGDPVIPALPMSVAWEDLAGESFPVVFEQAGGSCKMYWRQNRYSTLSLEFTRENADLPMDPHIIQ
jgi:hypothetical protein